MMTQTLSLAQMHIQAGDIPANLALAEEAIVEAARRSSQVILFPELWTTGYDLSRAHSLAQSNRPVIARLSELSQRYSLVIGGSMLLEQNGQVYNTFVYLSPGEAPVLYEKIHLFRLMEEDRWLASGNRLVQAGPNGQAGLAICYDLRFPELFRRYAVSGARLFLIPAEWPRARVTHWQTLLRARAIENQCFVAATNCVGFTAGETFAGCSAIISPSGETLVEGPAEQPELLTATIDLEQVERVRRQIPILQDRRPDLYA